MLTQERLKELLDYDPETGVFVWKSIVFGSHMKVGDIAGSRNPAGYIHIQIEGKMYRAHRLAWLYVHGCWPTNQIDHINRDPLDNRIVNLRDVTDQQNKFNKKGAQVNNTSGYVGVGWYKAGGKWRAQITTHGKLKYLGLFNTPEEAHAAYLAAKEELHNIGDQQ